MPPATLENLEKIKTIRVAVEGCCHGQLNNIYSSLPKNTELLIICGDFQAIRNQQDLESINVPPKYKDMGDFPDYYSGKKSAPVMTIFIGGNHESSSYMRELQYGGWVAPSIYYLGEFGTIWYKGLRISGVSGIFSYPSFIAAKSIDPPAYTLPYGQSAIRSIYHVKPKNFLKLLLSGSSDVVLTHDWPKGIWEWGHKDKLLKKKPFFKADIDNGRLGSPLAMEALKYLRPPNWFSSHMHIKFEATVRHENVEENEAKRRKIEDEDGKCGDNVDEISLDMDDLDEPSMAKKSVDSGTEVYADIHNPSSSNEKNNDTNEISIDMDDMDDPTLSEANNKDESVAKQGKDNKIWLESEMNLSENIQNKTKTEFPASETSFLALDKCLPKRAFLAIRHLKTKAQHPSFSSESLCYDPRAIAINKVVEKFVRSPNWTNVRAQDMFQVDKIKHLLAELDQLVDFEITQMSEFSSEFSEVLQNFQKIAPDVKEQEVSLRYWPNNQTQDYCEKWGIPEPDLNGV